MQQGLTISKPLWTSSSNNDNDDDDDDDDDGDDVSIWSRFDGGWLTMIKMAMKLFDNHD